MNAHGVANSVRYSALRFGAEIAARIDEGWTVERGSAEASSEDIRRIYTVRRGNLQGQTSAYVTDLVAAIDELLARIPSGETALRWYSVRHEDAEFHYTALFNQFEAVAGFRLQGNGAKTPSTDGSI